jgi:glycosyltransferase involved in cell wall biosynthesis
MKRNILVTATTFPRWKNDSEPSFVLNLCKELKKSFNIVVLAPHYKKAKKYGVIDGIKIYRFRYFFPAALQKVCYEGGVLENLKKSPIARLQIPFLAIFELISVLRLLKKEDIDIIHAHWIVPQGFLAHVTNKLTKKPYVVTAHAGDVFTLKNNLLKKLAKSTLKNSSYCTVNSSYTKKAVDNICKTTRIEVIPMGVNLKSFNMKKKSNFLKRNFKAKDIILFVGRLAEKKGLEYLIKAMPDVIRKFRNAKLLVIGKGPTENKLKQLTKKLNLDRKIIFLGKMSNEQLPKYYASSDVFVGPSIITKSGDTEGLGIVFLEAISSGIPVIGTNVGGIPDIIKNNKTGLLVEQKNSKELSKAIIKMISDNKLRKKLQYNAYQHIKEVYNWKNIGERFTKVFDFID